MLEQLALEGGGWIEPGLFSQRTRLDRLLHKQHNKFYTGSPKLNVHFSFKQTAQKVLVIKTLDY